MKKSRIISFIMALIMLLTVIPVQNLSAGQNDTGISREAYEIYLYFDGQQIKEDGLIKVEYHHEPTKEDATDDWRQIREELKYDAEKGAYTFTRNNNDVCVDSRFRIVVLSDEYKKEIVFKNVGGTAKCGMVYATLEKKYKVNLVYSNTKHEAQQDDLKVTNASIEKYEKNEKCSYEIYSSQPSKATYSVKVKGCVPVEGKLSDLSEGSNEIPVRGYNVEMESGSKVNVGKLIPDSSEYEYSLSVEGDNSIVSTSGKVITAKANSCGLAVVNVNKKQKTTGDAAGQVSDSKKTNVPDKLYVNVFSKLAYNDDNVFTSDKVIYDEDLNSTDSVRTIYLKPSCDSVVLPTVSGGYSGAETDYSIAVLNNGLSEAGFECELVNNNKIQVKDGSRCKGGTVEVECKTAEPLTLNGLTNLENGKQTAGKFRIVFLKDENNTDTVFNFDDKDCNNTTMETLVKTKYSLNYSLDDSSADVIYSDCYSETKQTKITSLNSKVVMADDDKYDAKELAAAIYAKGDYEVFTDSTNRTTDERENHQANETIICRRIYEKYKLDSRTLSLCIDKKDAEVKFLDTVEKYHKTAEKNASFEVSNEDKSEEGKVNYNFYKCSEENLNDATDSNNIIADNDNSMLQLRGDSGEEYSKNTGIVYKIFAEGVYQVKVNKPETDEYYASSIDMFFQVNAQSPEELYGSDFYFDQKKVSIIYDNGFNKHSNELKHEKDDEMQGYEGEKEYFFILADGSRSQSCEYATININSGEVTINTQGKVPEDEIITVGAMRTGDPMHAPSKTYTYEMKLSFLNVTKSMYEIKGDYSKTTNWFRGYPVAVGGADAVDEDGNTLKYLTSSVVTTEEANWKDSVVTLQNEGKDLTFEFAVRESTYVGDQRSADKIGKTSEQVSVDLQNPRATVRVKNSVNSTNKEKTFEPYVNLNSLYDELVLSKETSYVRSNSTLYFEATDDMSGIAKVYYYVASESCKDMQPAEIETVATWADYTYNGSDCLFEYLNFSRAVIFFKAVDNSGRTTYTSTSGLVCDSEKPEVKINLPAKKTESYNGDVKVTADISDANSGIDKVKYYIDNTVKEVDYKGGDSISFNVSAKDFNKNNISVVVEVTDKSGNTQTDTAMFSIDTTAPSIDVAYSNNDAVDSKYFSNVRVATVKITERDFDPSNVKISINNLDDSNEVPTISSWTSHSKQGGNGDSTYHTATISYSKDGNYTFDISYVDKAGNKNSAVDYGSSVAPTAFVVDKTNPKLDVTYDNNDVKNEKYYKNARKATISVDEHNFDESLVDFKVLEGEAKLSAWKHNGDTHTATVSFTEDGTYGWTISVADKGSLRSELFEDKEFVIDKTVPEVVIEGVADKTAYTNTDGISIKVSAKDENIDDLTAELIYTIYDVDQNKFIEKTIVGATKLTAKTATSMLSTVTKDGVYKLNVLATDKAGNESDADKNVLTFSINNNGSTFVPDEYTSSLMKGTYIQNVLQDIVIYEINADGFNKNKCSLSVNDVQLTGTNFSVKEVKEGGWYKNVYSAKVANFSEETEYNVVVNSSDANGTVAYSDVKGVKVNFVVDRTAPSINITGVEENGSYKKKSVPVTVIASDDGGKIQTLSVDICDKSGKVIESVYNLKGDKLRSDLEVNNGKIEFEMPEGNNLCLVVNASDVAGNILGAETGGSLVVKGITISESIIDVLFGDDKDSETEIGSEATDEKKSGINVYASAGGVVAIVVLLVVVVGFFVMKRKKKVNEN